MPYLLIPNRVTSTEAVAWLGIVNESDPIDAASVILRRNGLPVPVDTPWQIYATRSGKNSIRYNFFSMQGLEPRSDRMLELYAGTDLIAAANIRTLPAEMPLVGERPFTVLLGSCFASGRPVSTWIGNTYLGLRDAEKPEIKILCGDQVYLDDPAINFTLHNYSVEDLEDLHFGNYVRTWSQSGLNTGNLHFLSSGANFFSSDDHESWNNAPDFATLVRNTYTQAGRDAWRKIALSLLRVFQTDRSVTQFEVGDVPFFIADTRVNRGPGKNEFMSIPDRNELAAWVLGLKGPGVLVIGQPIFMAKAGRLSSWFVDKNLSDYEQYEDLVQILNQTNQSVVILTGDVHFGRISKCLLRENIFVHEIISSPLTLVDSRAGGKWDPPPERFPDFAVPGATRQVITPNSNFKRWGNHFLTLAFYKDGAKINVIVKTVEIPNNGQPPVPVLEDTLSL